MRKQNVMYAALLATSVCLSEVFATSPTHIQPRIDADISIQFPETVRLNEKFRIECNVEIKGCVPHYSGHSDLVKLMIPWNCRVDSGSVEWSGRLDQGSLVTLAVVVHAEQTGKCEIGGRAYASSLEYDSDNYMFWANGNSREIKVIDSAAPTPAIKPRKENTFGDGGVSNPSLRVAEKVGGAALRENFDSLAYLPGPIIHCIELPIDSLRTGTARVEYYSGTMNYLRVVSDPLQYIAGDEFVSVKSWRIRQREGSVIKMDEGWMEIVMAEPLESFVAQLMIADTVFPLTVVRVEIPDSLGPYKKFRPFPRTAPVIQWAEMSIDSLRTGNAEFEYRVGTSNWIRFTEFDAEVGLNNPVIRPDKWDIGGHYRKPPAESDTWLSLDLYAPFDTVTVHLEFKGERLSFLMRYPLSKK